MKRLFMIGVLLSTSVSVGMAQQPTARINEKRVGLGETAVAFDSSGAAALEASLSTQGLNGSAESPVTNVRMLVRNSSNIPLSFASGVVTFYDSNSVRCGESVFKTEALAVGEQFETDLPGIRIRCNATAWRVVATNLLPVFTPPAIPAAQTESRAQLRLLISIDGEQHPIQLDKPIKLSLGDRERTIVVREQP